MPRTARASAGEVCYHVLNRGNARQEVFHQVDGYRTFMKLIGRACARLPMRVLAWCLMPSHFHLVLWPYADGDLGRWMHWLLTSHVRGYHRWYHSSGHVWQGRFKAFPIQHDEHLLTVLRYVERNPLQANLVERAQDWPWSSITMLYASPPALILHPGPCPRGDDWLRLVSQPQAEAELQAVRTCVQRGAPYGRQPWRKETALRLGLEFTLRPRRRPKTDPKK